MKLNDEYITRIEKITNLGAGIARIEGFVVFVENSCPDDEVKIKITKINKNFAIGEIIEIIHPSSDRVEPFCPMYKVCGACQIQNIKYEKQLEIKKEITQDAMKNIAHLDINIPNTIPSPKIKNYRHKIQYPVSQTKVSGRILAGYYKPKTHDLVNIKHCPIQPEICDKIIEFIREKAGICNIQGYREKTHSGDLRHVVIRNSAVNNKNLVVLVVNADKVLSKFNEFAKLIYENFDEVNGVCINFNTQKTNVIFGKKTVCLFGKDYIEEKILDKTFKIGADTFFQVNPESAENIFRYVKEFLQNNCDSPVVLDAYAGISSFGIAISDVCQKVVTVEEVKASCDLAKEVAKLNNIKNIEIYNEDAAKFLRQTGGKFDAVILDPPRKGCSEESLKEACRLSDKYIIYVSCNPATLARDLKILCDIGCSVESVQPFDMFCHTYHVENVAIIKV